MCLSRREVLPTSLAPSTSPPSPLSRPLSPPLSPPFSSPLGYHRRNPSRSRAQPTTAAIDRPTSLRNGRMRRGSCWSSVRSASRGTSSRTISGGSRNPQRTGNTAR
ncbi:hypothetical protein JCM24511_07677 [Saitozyma sp. JCM 24511]|nr:hypothetical protein JCM24511_07677 [Saitozyma sp. JCM 24511]